MLFLHHLYIVSYMKYFHYIFYTITLVYNIKVSSVNGKFIYKCNAFIIQLYFVVLSVAVAVPIVLSMLSNMIILYFEELCHLCT